jgi:hypothetical protein
MFFRLQQAVVRAPEQRAQYAIPRRRVCATAESTEGHVDGQPVIERLSALPGRPRGATSMPRHSKRVEHYSLKQLARHDSVASLRKLLLGDDDLLEFVQQRYDRPATPRRQRRLGWTDDLQLHTDMPTPLVDHDSRAAAPSWQRTCQVGGTTRCTCRLTRAATSLKPAAPPKTSCARCMIGSAMTSQPASANARCS